MVPLEVTTHQKYWRKIKMTIYPYTKARILMKGLAENINLIKNQYKKELETEKLKEIKSVLEQNIRSWKNEQVQVLKGFDEQLPKRQVLNIPNLTAEEITVLNYKTEMLKNHLQNVRTEAEMNDIRNELLNSNDKQLQQAFLNSHTSLKELNVDLGFPGRYTTIMDTTLSELKQALKTPEDIALDEQVKQIEEQRQAFNFDYMMVEGNAKSMLNQLNNDLWGK